MVTNWEEFDGAQLDRDNLRRNLLKTKKAKEVGIAAIAEVKLNVLTGPMEFVLDYVEASPTNTRPEPALRRFS